MDQFKFILSVRYLLIGMVISSVVAFQAPLRAVGVPRTVTGVGTIVALANNVTIHVTRDGAAVANESGFQIYAPALFPARNDEIEIVTGSSTYSTNSAGNIRLRRSARWMVPLRPPGSPPYAEGGLERRIFYLKKDDIY